MKIEVRVRHLNEATGHGATLCEISPDEGSLTDLVAWIRRAGGFYSIESGAAEPFCSWQFVLDTDAYIEIIVGQEPDQGPGR